MRYELYVNESGEKRVKFLDYKSTNGKYIDYCVNKDDEGNEYFPIPNMKNCDRLFLFNDRIQDAIECIREGEGDVLNSNKTGCALFGGDSVYRFVNRQYGEQMRKKTIEGWNGTKFGYGLKFGYKNSFNSGSLLDTKGDRYYGLDNQIKLTFNTESEAETYKEKILNTAKRLNDRYGILKINNSNRIDKFLDDCFNKHKIEFDIMCSEDKEYYLNVVQIAL